MLLLTIQKLVLPVIPVCPFLLYVLSPVNRKKYHCNPYGQKNIRREIVEMEGGMNSKRLATGTRQGWFWLSGQQTATRYDKQKLRFFVFISMIFDNRHGIVSPLNLQSGPDNLQNIFQQTRTHRIVQFLFAPEATALSPQVPPRCEPGQ